MAPGFTEHLKYKETLKSLLNEVFGGNRINYFKFMYIFFRHMQKPTNFH